MKSILWSLLLTAGVLSVEAVDPILSDEYTKYSVSVSVGPSKGSGFFLLGTNSVYLVTARHVLFDTRQARTNWHLWAAEAECVYVRTEAETDRSTMRMDLGALLRGGEVRYHADQDIALVRVEQCISTNKAIVRVLPGVSFTAGNAILSPHPLYKDGALGLRKLNDVTVGTEIYIVGFPSSLGLPNLPQIDQSLPLMKRGIIAGKNIKRRNLILDCTSFQGNSGGPVIARIPDGSITACPIVGIISEFVPFSEEWQNSRYGFANTTLSNSGYSVAIPMDFVFELLWD